MVHRRLAGMARRDSVEDNYIELKRTKRIASELYRMYQLNYTVKKIRKTYL